jgi:hypothetical protein
LASNFFVHGSIAPTIHVFDWNHICIYIFMLWEYIDYVEYLRWYKFEKGILIKRWVVKQKTRPIAFRHISFGAKKSWSSVESPAHWRSWSLVCSVVIREPEAILSHSKKHKIV